MKKIFVGLFMSFLFISVYAQNVFMYGENGKKVYFQETDSLVQIKFKKDISNNERSDFLKTINPDIDIPFSKNNRLVISVKKNKHINYVDLKKSNLVIYVNQSLMDKNGTIQIPTEKVLVKIKNGYKLGEILRRLDIDYDRYKRLGHNKDSYMIVLKCGESLNISNMLYESGYFEYAQPSFTRFFDMINTYYPDQWGLNNTGQNEGTAGIDINAPEAWEITTGSDDVTVAVIDQGVDLDHPDLAGNLLTGYDATDGGNGGINGDCWGDDAHGTCCAGIVGAIDNTFGTIGVAPDCSIIPIRVSYELFGMEQWEDDWVIDAINHAWEVADADVLSCSWHYANVLAISNEISDALNYGRNNLGCVVVFAAGNNNNSSVNYPANSNADVIAVGAMSPCGERKRSSSNTWELNPGVSPDPENVSCDGEKWWGSNYGNELDLVAPGVFIPTTDIQDMAGNNDDSGTDGDYYLTFNGTSAATPHVAGVAALILSANPDLTQDEARDIIESTCTKVGGYSYSTTTGRSNGTWDDEVGYGCVNAYNAVLNAIGGNIAGTDVVCTSNTTFSLTGETSGLTLHWECSNGLLTEVSDNDDPSYVVKAKYSSSSGAGWVKVTITNGFGEEREITKTVWVGNILPLGLQLVDRYTGYPYYLFCSGQANLVKAVHADGEAFIDEWDWDVSGGYIAWSNSDNSEVTIYPTNSSTFAIELRAHNDCGWSEWADMGVGVTSCGYSLAISPNPTTDEATVAIENTTEGGELLKSASTETTFDENSEWDIEVYDSMQSLKLKKQKLKGRSTSINTQSWKEGVYMVRVRYNDEILTGKLIVKK